MMAARSAGGWRGAWAWLQAFPLRFARGRRAESLPLRLDRHRIYILPTRAGLGFALLLFVMIGGALNYQNNAALLLSCMLGACFAASMLWTWRELHDLTLRAIHAEHGFCSARVPLNLAFAEDRHQRPGLRVSVDALEQPCPLAPGSTRARITVPAPRRGWVDAPRMQLSSTLPFGLFHTWAWITPAQRLLVYPRPLHDLPPPPRADDPTRRTLGGDDLAGLRAYHAGDPIRHVAWKASARHGDLLVREFDHAAARQPLRFDWAATGNVDRETRISRLTGWICDAYAAGHTWTLVLDDQRQLGPAANAAHYHHCLTTLAELP